MNDFAQLAKIKNGKVEELRRELQAAQSELMKRENALNLLSVEFAAMVEPESGAFGDLAIASEKRGVYRREIDAARKEIFTAHQKVFQIRFLLKKALVEYEKINHLDREEKAFAAIAAKKSEDKRLDDAAINARYILRSAE
ncbi:MAG: flagellar FliJ family protein [Helicobacteraceae bacterium]|jgi:flagellar biosynthesis chaperone FliJ|nr:flagellar FliJ family protein [Helicobacteraceae bacterium]